MNRILQKKNVQLKALDVDNHKKQVKVAIAELESVDRDNDIFDPSAFDKTIRENGPKGSNEIWHLLDHGHKSFSALGKFSELGREGKYIVGVSTYKDSFAWREVAWPLYESGDISQHSVGFETLDSIEPKAEDSPRVITGVRLYEGSAVMWGANPNTPTLEIVKKLLSDDDKDITAAEKIEEVIKKIRNHKRGFIEEDSSLLIIELKHLQKVFDTKNVVEIFRGPATSKATPDVTITDSQSQMKATGPELTATPPETVECPKCKKITHNTMAQKGYIKCHRCNAVSVYGSKDYMEF